MEKGRKFNMRDSIDLLLTNVTPLKTHPPGMTRGHLVHSFHTVCLKYILRGTSKENVELQIPACAGKHIHFLNGRVP